MGQEITLTITSWGVLMISIKYLSNVIKRDMLIGLTIIRDETSQKVLDSR